MDYKHNRLAVGVAFASFLTLAAGSVMATPGTNEVQVKYRESDFDSAQKVKRFYRKVEYSAWLACEPPRGADDTFLDNAEARACQKNAVDRTIGRINDPRLTTYHADHSRNGRDTTAR